jgi:hypothetical protein
MGSIGASIAKPVGGAGAGLAPNRARATRGTYRISSSGYMRRVAPLLSIGLVGWRANTLQLGG